MLHCLNTSGNLVGACSEMTVLERQRARTKWQQQDDFSSALGEVVAHSMKPDPGFENGWPDFGSPASVFDVNSDISRSCSGLERELVSLSPMCGKETFKKRKADNKVVSESKRIKVNVVEEVESKTTEQTRNKNNAKSTNGNKNKREISVNTNSKENSKGSEVQNQKTDYIHVRARRGQATDSHSLAERVRREKISERMKYLQDLVPGCNKIAGKAGMLDEIINYVQSLQRQVEFLSMKLAAVNPRLDFNIDELFAKEVFPQNFPTIGMQQDMMTNPSYLQFNSAQQQQQQLVSCYGGLINNMGLITQDIGLRRNINPPAVSLPEMFLDSSSCFTQHILPSSTWESDFQNVAFDQERSTSFPSHQPFTGLVEASNLKMEM